MKVYPTWLQPPLATLMCSLMCIQGFSMHRQEGDIDAMTVLYIPVVVHVVHNAERGFVTDQQVFEQLNVLNEDYSRSNADTLAIVNSFKAFSENARIQFFLARENGALAITRKPTTHGPFFNDDIHRSEAGGSDPWDASVYLNIWVADLAEGVLGYAAVPGSATQGSGVTIDFEYFGRYGSAKAPYHLGRTATHEIGHWLGLSHPWGEGDCLENDQVGDTPPQDRPTDGCNLSFQSCGSLAMTQNFMNTAGDQCLLMFTHDQVNLMRETLTSKRPDNYTTQPPVITSVESEMRDPAIEVFPNPSQGKKILSCSMSSDIKFVSAHHVSGKSVHATWDAESRKIDLSDLPPGIYLLIFSDKVRSYKRKVILTN